MSAKHTPWQVVKIEPETYFKQQYRKSPCKTTWAITNGNRYVSFRLRGFDEIALFPTKKVAQKEAEFLNEQAIIKAESEGSL